ncbi:unnamed protein product, partial [Onchocerca ochengi]|uniref:tRNA_edit domain-containing protein n=1 Tax=Onchocerca ochengi TaxID=42157 RepID=A0A182EY87_ONCOC
EWQSQILGETNVTLQEKIALSREQIVDYVRKAKNFHSAPLKSLEKETDCQILIRGKGSLLVGSSSRISSEELSRLGAFIRIAPFARTCKR